MNPLILIVALFVQNVALIPGAGTISGQLRGANGQSVAGIRVGAVALSQGNAPLSSTSAIVSLALTDNAGRYRLENVAPGRYYVIAGLVDTPTYYPGVPSLAAATTVTVAPSGAVTGIDFPIVVSAGITVKGRVVKPPNMTGGLSRVLLSGSNGQDTTINPDGSFEFRRVRAGTYVLLVPGAQLAQPVSVVAADRDITDVEVALLWTRQVTIRGVVEGGGILPRLSVSFSSLKGGISLPNAVVFSNAPTINSLPEGEYRIGWTGLPAGYRVKSIMAGSHDLLASSLNIGPDAAADPIVFTLAVNSPPPWVKVSGRVTGLNTAGAGPYRLSLSGASMDGLEAAVNSDGAFAFERVLPGTYIARLLPALPVPPTNIVIPTKDVTNIEIALPALKEVSGHIVVEAAGQRAPAVSLTLTTVTSGMSAGTVINPPADGAFKVALPVGEFRVTAFSVGYAVRSFTYGSADLMREPLKLSSSSDTDLRIVLSPTLGATTGVVNGGVIGGVLGGVIAPTPAPPPPPPPPSPTSPLPAGVNRVSGEIAQTNLVSHTPPVYPEVARAARIQGTVIVEAVISKEGTVSDLRVISGHPLLTQAALDAIKTWKYKPIELNGQPTAVVTTITVNFAFQ